MSQQRIQPIEAPFSKELQDSFDIVMPEGMPPLNIFRTIANNPRVLSRMVRGGLLDEGSVTTAQRELVILRTCAVCNAEYEWGVHVAAFSGAAGLNQQQIADTRAAETNTSLWSEEQQHIITMVDELHSQYSVSDSTWEVLKEHFRDEQMIELVMLAGLYHAVSFVVNAFQITNEPFGQVFPENSKPET